MPHASSPKAETRNLNWTIWHSSMLTTITHNIMAIMPMELMTSVTKLEQRKTWQQKEFSLMNWRSRNSCINYFQEEMEDWHKWNLKSILGEERRREDWHSRKSISNEK